MTKTIYIFRHGQTDYNVARRVMGQLDIPLNDVGRIQAAELANKLETATIDVIYSSPLTRAIETARAIADKIGAPIITDARLMERNNGKLQGHIVHGTDNPSEYQMDYNQLELFWPASQLNDDNWQPDGGESRAECWARYSPHPFKRQMRPLWYYIQCERLNLRIEPKFIKKIKKYKDNPAECINRVLKHRYNIAPGTTIIRHFRNIEHRVLVNYDNTFLYNGKQYRSLSAIASDICGAKTSGPHFFELDKRKLNAGD